MKLHFISGFPRSGSTLLSALLRQNPRFAAGMTSPVSQIFTAVLAAMSNKNEFSVFLNEAQKLRQLRGVFEAYYAEYPGRAVAFDTSRLWCSKMPTLARLFPQSKIICCVRNPAWVVDSVERLIRRNSLDLSAIFGFDAGGTVYSRSEGLLRGDGMVGFARNAVREAFYGQEADRLILLQYESLTADPAAAMALLYDLLGEPPFAHDFENIAFDEPEFDTRLGTPGLHQVASRVHATPRPTILPPDLFSRCEAEAFWRDETSNPNNVVII
jgi:sulfotransferase